MINSAKKLVTSPLEMASSQYSSVFSTPTDENISPHNLFPDPDDTQGIDNIVFHDSELADAMKDLSANAAPGPDESPAILLK